MSDSFRPWLAQGSLRLKPYDEGEIRQLEIYRSMTPAQRLEQSFRLRETAWALQKAGLRLRYPEASEQELEDKVRRVFLSAGA